MSPKELFCCQLPIATLNISPNTLCHTHRHSGAMWRCFRDKLSQDCPELMNDFDELLQEVMNDYEEQEITFE